MKIKCEHPVIIENPYLKYLVSKYQKVYLKDHWLNLSIFDHLKEDANGDKFFCGKVTRNRTIWSDWESKYHPLFWKTRTGVTIDNIDDFYIVTPDGEMLPVYMVVPCGKCCLCREKKVKMWMTRCLAETVTSNYPPLFITLTYRDADLPADGVNIVDYQKFLKRLRIRLERHFGKKFNLRYLIVAEYGTQKKRPHYHMLLLEHHIPYACTSYNTYQTHPYNDQYQSNHETRHPEYNHVRPARRIFHLLGNQ